MPIEEITRYLHTGAGADRRRLYMMLAIHCAPFLKGLKESAMLTLSREQALDLVRLAPQAGLSWYFLCHEAGKDMVFLYRREAFCRYLRRPEVDRFLRALGYQQEEGSGRMPSDGMASDGMVSDGMATDRTPTDRTPANRIPAFRILEELSRRMKRYYDGTGPFPHEVGVLLGYPAEDVEAYIRHDGKGCLLVGYWKVYHNPRRAARIFAAFDEARERTVREVLDGKELRQLCVS